MFQFKLNQVVFYFQDNKVHSAKILSRMFKDNSTEFASNPEQRHTFERFGESCELYATIHGEYEASQLFSTRLQLREHLFPEDMA